MGDERLWITWLMCFAWVCVAGEIGRRLMDSSITMGIME
jgi:hypothetical protein